MDEKLTVETGDLLEALLMRVAEGAEVTLTRHGEEAARLVQTVAQTERRRPERVAQARAAAERIRGWQRVPLSGQTLRDIIEAGRA